LRGFVAKYMTGAGLDVGMAGADEVCRTKKGDCTEFAVLLAAMLRAADIPSRVVCGVVYCDEFAGKKDVFGPHMWTQALVDHMGVKVWVDVDAAIGPGERAFDGGHIAFSTSALSDDVPATASFSELLPFLGKVTVEVEGEE
ncbi:MAG TPA: transglutaminase-like domain-containing protein, partial [Phycisphaerales bacterium]|nr:transglutaminase-like domain-containing protein [Phycisphaerales bacterium]